MSADRRRFWLRVLLLWVRWVVLQFAGCYLMGLWVLSHAAPLRSDTPNALMAFYMVGVFMIVFSPLLAIGCYNIAKAEDRERTKRLYGFP